MGWRTADRKGRFLFLVDINTNK